MPSGTPDCLYLLGLLDGCGLGLGGGLGVGVAVEVIDISSTVKTSVAPAGMVGGAPWSP